MVTWPVHLICANFRRVCTLCIPALFRTSVSGILSCHLIFRSFLRQHAVGKLSKFCMRIIVYAAAPICILSTLCQVCFHFYFHVVDKCCTSLDNPSNDFIINVYNSRPCASKVGEPVYHLQSLTFHCDGRLLLMLSGAGWYTTSVFLMLILRS